MNQITIVDLDGENKHEYVFNIFGFKAVLVGYVKYQKTGIRKWTKVGFWDNYNKRDSNLSEPKLTPALIGAVKQQIINQLSVLESKEYFK